MERILSVIAVLGPIVGLLVGAGLGVAKRDVGYYLPRAYLVGCVGLLVYLVWCVPQWNRHYETKQKIPAAWKRNQPSDMRELIDPDAAETAMRVLPTVVVVAGLLGGWLMGWLRKKRGAFVRGAFVSGVGVLAYLLWCAYNYHVRWDPQTGYSGLDKVRVLLINLLMFVAAGLALGGGCNIVAGHSETAENVGEPQAAEG
jgi:MFS family permease